MLGAGRARAHLPSTHNTKQHTNATLALFRARCLRECQSPESEELLGRGCGGGFGRGRRRLSSSGGRARSAAAVGCGCVRCEVCGGCRNGCFCRLGSTRQVCSIASSGVRVGFGISVGVGVGAAAAAGAAAGATSSAASSAGGAAGAASSGRGLGGWLNHSVAKGQWNSTVRQYIRICPCMSQ